MVYVVGSHTLHQRLTAASLLSPNGTAAAFLRRRGKGGSHRKQISASAFPAYWTGLLSTLNPSQSLRILFDSLSETSKPYFFASIDGVASGPFDVILDPLRRESLLLGQQKLNAGRTFYDVWASYHVPDFTFPAVAFRALRYSIDTSILANNSLKAKTDIRFRAETGGERLLALQFSHMLNIDEVTSEQGEPLTFFQNEGMTLRERSTRGNDFLYVVLPTAPARGAEFSLRFRYPGNILWAAGNGVLYVGTRLPCYPHFGD